MEIIAEYEDEQNGVAQCQMCIVPKAGDTGSPVTVVNSVSGAEIAIDFLPAFESDNIVEHNSNARA